MVIRLFAALALLVVPALAAESPYCDDCTATQKNLRELCDYVLQHKRDMPTIFVAGYYMRTLVAGYELFGDRKYLKPIELSLELVRKHISQSEKSAEIGSEAWAAAILRDSGDFWEVTEVWRLLTGDTTFDDLLLKNGSPYLKYRLESNITVIENQLIRKRLFHNWLKVN